MDISKELWFDALDYFGDQDRAIMWFKTPNLALGLITPESYLQQPGGTERVRDLINRLRHGFTA